MKPLSARKLGATLLARRLAAPLAGRKLAAVLPARPLAAGFPGRLLARLLAAALPLLAALALAGCGTSTASGVGDGKPQVVAAENFWGSLASQLGGSKVTVHSIIVNPSTDPHSYEPTASDAITMARSQMAIVNGIGYDAWASHLLAADPSSNRIVLNVGNLLGLQDGDNPHQWYSPASVRRVIDQIVADYQRRDPRDRRYFRAAANDRPDARSGGLPRGHRRHPGSLRRRPGGLQRGHLPAAG